MKNSIRNMVDGRTKTAGSFVWKIFKNTSCYSSLHSKNKKDES